MSFNNQKFALCYQLPSTHRWLCETNYDSIESADKRAFALTPIQTILFPYSSNLFLQSRLKYKLSTFHMPEVNIVEKPKNTKLLWTTPEEI